MTAEQSLEQRIAQLEQRVTEILELISTGQDRQQQLIDLVRELCDHKT